MEPPSYAVNAGHNNPVSTRFPAYVVLALPFEHQGSYQEK